MSRKQVEESRKGKKSHFQYEVEMEPLHHPRHKVKVARRAEERRICSTFAIYYTDNSKGSTCTMSISISYL